MRSQRCPQPQLDLFGPYYLERDLLECCRLLARQARIVLDVGANAGISSLAGLAAKSASIVHAFEPPSEIATPLGATAAANTLWAPWSSPHDFSDTEIR